MELIEGKEFKRKLIHDHYGGSRQGGISSCKGHPYIFIFSTPRGEENGYSDGWSEDGMTFYYSGEGQVGDMEFTRGNKAILEHAKINKIIVLFEETKKSYVKLVAFLHYVDHELSIGPDRNNNFRKVIRFILQEGTYSPDNPLTASSSPIKQKNYIKPDKTSRRGLVTTRVGQGYYRQELLDKFEHRCAISGLGLTEVLIASHIVPWRDSSEEERLDPNNGILLSPQYDALFDKHLLSFSDDGRILLSPRLTIEEIKQLGIDINASIAVTEGMKPYLKRHRESLRMINIIKVTLGFIFDDDGNVLLAQRSLTKHYGGLWEFPGGKVEPEESIEQTMVRELSEELKIETKVIKEL